MNVYRRLVLLLPIALSISGCGGGARPAPVGVAPPVEAAVKPFDVVVLEACRDSIEPVHCDRWGRLVMEMYRQALLVAARDELGLATRDTSLDEIAPPQGALSVAMRFPATPDRDLRIEITSDAADPSKPQPDPTVLTAPIEDHADYLNLLTVVEKLSFEEFPALLKKQRSTPTEQAAVGALEDEPLPADLTALLEQPTFLAQWRAVRALHALGKTRPASIQRLAALARSYTVLGALCEYQYHPAHKAYKARGLLYAQRLRRLAPEDPRGLWTRASVFALVGMPRLALADVAAAKELAAKKPNATPPAWVAAIEQAGRLEWEPLVKTALNAPPADAGYLRLLALQTAEHALPTGRYFAVALKLVGDRSDALRVYDSLCENMGVGIGHAATESYETAMQEKLPKEWAEWKDAGDAAKDGSEGKWTEAAKALRSTTLDGEPTAPSLALWLREAQFQQVYHRARFLAEMLGVDDEAKEYVAARRGALADHPYVAAIDACGGDQRNYVERLRSLEFAHPDVNAVRLTLARLRVDPGNHTGFVQCQTNDDLVLRDLRVKIGLGSDAEFMRKMAACLDVAAVDDPYAAVARMKGRWDEMKPTLPEVEKRFRERKSGLVLGTMGMQYAERKEWPAAVRCLEPALEWAPTRETYQYLAEGYFQQGDQKRWLATLDRYLRNEPDFGLDHATVCVGVAHRLLKLGRPNLAARYGDLGAESWAGWAFQMAIEANTEAGNWKKAEEQNIAMALRYPDTGWFFWYAWCAATGRGDEAKARQFNERMLKQVEENIDHVDNGSLQFAATSRLFQGDDAAALRLYDVCQRRFSSGNSGLMAAYLAQKQGDFAARDEFLRRTAAGPVPNPHLSESVQDSYKQIVEIARKMAAAADPRKKLSLNVYKVEEWKKADGSSDVRDVNAVIGLFLESEERWSDAASYFKVVVERWEANNSPHFIARWRLRLMQEAGRVPKPNGPKPEPFEKPRPPNKPALGVS
ncbi:MAG: tetratricopeptide repeat protein [Planctomycetia bacterium]